MTALTGRTPSGSYPELLKINKPGAGGVDTTLRNIEDGLGTATPLALATNKISLHGYQWPVSAAAAGSVLRISTTAGALEWYSQGNMAAQNSNAVAITGGTIKGMPTPLADSDVAIKSYVDDSVANFADDIANLTTDNITEGANLYYTQARVRSTISVSGSLAYNSTTGVISYTQAVSSVFGRTGAVTLTTNDVTTALGFTPLNKAGDTISGDFTVTGNLTVNGTTTSVNSIVTSVQDPVLTLGGGPNGAAPTSNDSKDRGIAFQWHNGTTAKTGFFGFDASTSKFTFVPDATITNEVVSGTVGSIVANITGVADTAVKLQTARTINGKSFDGTANVTLLTTDVAEGTNQYFTTTRARTSISATGSIVYNSGTGVLSYTESVTSVSGKTGVITLDTSDVVEGATNLYFTTSRAAAAAPVQSVFGRTGTVVLSSSDIATALGYTPASSTGGSFTGTQITFDMLTFSSTKVSLSSTTTTTINSTAARSIKYLCQVLDTVTGYVHVEEILATVSNGNVFVTSFGVVTSNGDLGTFNVTYSSGNVTLTFTCNSSNATEVTTSRTIVA